MTFPKAMMAAAVALALAAIGPAPKAEAAEITLKLSDDEQKALVELLDLAVKAGGIGAARNVGFFYDKITALQAAATKPPAVDEPPPAEDK